MKRCWLVVMLAVWLAACGAAVPAPIETSVPSATPTRIVAQAPTATTTPRPAPTATLPKPTPTRWPTSTPRPSATPSATPTPAIAPQAEPFFDCTFHPNITGCSDNPLPLHGKLAFVDTEAWLHVVDLDSGQGWRYHHPPGDYDPTFAWDLEWLPDGQQLKAGYDNYTRDSLTFNADGTVITRSQELRPSFAKKITSADGTTAWIETQGDSKTLYVQFASTEIITWSLDGITTSDAFHALGDWVPHTPLLIAEYYYAASGTMIYGGYLYTINVQTGEWNKLDIQTNYWWNKHDWHPTEPALIAIQNTHKPLVLIDFINAQREEISEAAGWSPLWSPDGRLLAYGMDDWEHRDQRGIKLFNLQTRTTNDLTTPPADSDDDPIRWLDDQHLLYSRDYHIKADSFTELRVVALDGRRDAVLITQLPTPLCIGDCPWQLIFAWQP